MDGSVAVPRQVVQFGAKFNLGVQSLIPSNGLARISSIATEDGGEGAFGPVVALIVDFSLRQGIDQVKLLLLVSTESLSTVAPRITLAWDYHGTTDVGLALGTISVFRHAVETTSYVAALTVHAGAVGILVLNEVVVEDFTMILGITIISGIAPYFTTTLPIGFDWIIVL